MESLIWSWGEVEKFYETVIPHMYDQRNNPYMKDGVSLLFLASRKNYYPEPVRPYVKSAIFIHREILKNLGLPNGLDELKRKLKRMDFPEGAFNNTLISNKGGFQDATSLPPEALSHLMQYNLTKTKTYNPNTGRFEETYIFDVPKETMVIYMPLIVHSTTRASSKLVSKILQLQEQAANFFHNAYENGFPPEKVEKESYILFRQYKRLNTEFTSMVHKSIKEKRLAIVDIDFESEDLLERVLTMIHLDTGVEPLAVTRTHGGYHVIYDKTTSKDFNAYLFKAFNHNWKKTWIRLGITGENVLMFTSDGIVTDKKPIAHNVVKWVQKRFGVLLSKNVIAKHKMGYKITLPEGIVLKDVLSSEKAFEEFIETVGAKLVKGGVELKANPMTSIPGTYHGGVKVRIIDYSKYL